MDLEAHLRHHPDDEKTWAVYGDVLESKGDVRGELIRLEQLASGQSETDAKREKTLKSIAALVTKHKKTWSGDAPGELRWKHGFVVGLATRWTEESAESLPRFLASDHARLLHTLAITGFGEQEDAFDEEEFDEESGVAISTVDAAISHPALKAVLALDLSRVITLSFAYCQMGEAGIELLAAAPALGGVEQLDLRYNFIGAKGLARLLDAKFLPSMRVLHLQANAIDAKAAKAFTSAVLPKLEALDLRQNPLEPAGAKALATAPFLSQLKRLDLARHDVGAAGAKALAAAPLAPSLKTYWRALHADPTPWPGEGEVEDDDEGDEGDQAED
ncbi:MAG: hypothetical protein JNM17_39050 [Archangium sp.]|nr:hypothetical protein [Archangium sp.]